MRARWPWLTLVLSGMAFAAPPTMFVTAGGDCKDAELLTDVTMLTDALRARVGVQVLTPDQVAQALGGVPSHSVDELQRLFDSAQTRFFQGDHAGAEHAVGEILSEVERLPPSADRWKLAASAFLLQSQIDHERGRQEQADEGFRHVLRIDPAFQLDPDYFAPSVRKRFDKLRADLARARRAALIVDSTPSAAEVYLDGRRVGQTPFRSDVAAGTYQVLVAKDGAASFPHSVTVKADAALHVDLKFEGAVQRRNPCVVDGGDERTRLANAVKFATVLGVDQAIVCRLERQATGPAWFAALMVHAPTAQKVREGGLKVDSGRAPDGLDELAEFIVTGQPNHKVLTEPPRATPVAVAASSPPAPAAALLPPAAIPVATETPAVTASAPETKSWKTTTAYVLGGAGVLLGAGAAYFWQDSSQAWTQFNAYYPNHSAPTPDQLTPAAGVESRAKNEFVIGWVGAGLGAAALGTGAFLYFTDHGSGSGFGWSATLTPNGAAIVGRLP